MALFGVCRGGSARLDQQSLHDGWAWLTTDDGNFYIDATDDNDALRRIHINPKSGGVPGTLLASAWVNGTQTVSVSGLGANQNGNVGLSQSATKAQASAASKAKLRISGQSAGTVTITADGDVPEIDIPIAVVLQP